MAKVSISMGKHRNGSIIIKGITAKMKPRLKKELRQAGGDLKEQIMKHLRTYMRVTPAGRKFPAFQTGGLFRSVASKIFKSGMAVKIGPNTDYALFNEVGTSKIKARPYVWPAWLKLRKKIVKRIAKSVSRP